MGKSKFESMYRKIYSPSLKNDPAEDLHHVTICKCETSTSCILKALLSSHIVHQAPYSNSFVPHTYTHTHLEYEFKTLFLPQLILGLVWSLNLVKTTSYSLTQLFVCLNKYKKQSQALLIFCYSLLTLSHSTSPWEKDL